MNLTGATLNLSLDLALAWGSNWAQPIQSRLAAKVDTLSSSDLNEYNNSSQEVLNVGFQFISSRLEGVCDARETIKEKVLKTVFVEYMVSRYPWINEENLKKIFSQALYYAWKDGLVDCVK